MSVNRNLRAKRLALAALVILPLCLRLLTPVGYMPGSLADGTPFTLCPNSMPGAATLLAYLAGPDEHHHHHHGGSEESADSPWEFCGFGVAFTATATAFETSLSIRHEPGAVAPLRPPVIFRPGYTRTFHARGPPLIAS